MNDVSISSTEEVTNTAPEQDSGEIVEQTTPESDTGENATEVTTEASTENDSGQEESEANTEDDKKSGKGFEKRIERFNRRLAEKEAEIEHWRKAALAQSGNTQAQTPQVQQELPPKPTFDQFNDLETYTEAVTDWKLQHALQQLEQRNAQQAVAKTYAEKEQVVRKANPDYDEVIAEFRESYKHVNAPEINQYLVESDMGPALYYHLANNTAEVDRILALPPIRRIGELGKLEARLAPAGAGTAKVAPKVSKAPAPVTPEKGNSPVTKTLESIAKDNNASQAEYRELRMRNRRRIM